MISNSMLSVSNITKTYAQRKVLDQISFEVQKGRVHGFLGPNGAGKSTTMKILAGIISSDSGQVKICGIDLQKDLAAGKKKVGILPENPPLYQEMTVKDYLNFVAKLYGHKGAQALKQVNLACERLKLHNQFHRIIGNLSKGYKQRVGVAQALVSDPEILLLDEPTIGLDPKAVVEMRELIAELAKEKTILLSSHLLHEVSLVCQDITIINEGRILQSGSLEDITKSLNADLLIRAKVENTHQEKIQSLLKLPFVQKVDAVQNELKIYVQSAKDIRAKLSQEIVNSGLGLLEYSQDRIDLESLFVELTGELADELPNESTDKIPNEEPGEEKK